MTDGDVVTGIHAALDAAAADARISALVLTGEGALFCSGADLHHIQTLGSDDAAGLIFVRAIRALIERMTAFPKPIIGAVNGNARAGGYELLLGCDIIIAAEDSLIGDCHRGFTLPGAGSLTRSTYRVGASLARHLLLTGDALPASRFLACGFVHSVVPHTRLADAVTAVLAQLSEKTQQVLETMKRVMIASTSLAESSALAEEYAAFERHCELTQVRGGMALAIEPGGPET